MNESGSVAVLGGADDVVMIWRSGPDMGCTYFSDSWLFFTGRSAAEQIGDGWATGVHPKDLERCLAVYTSAFAAREEFHMTYRLRRGDGVYRWILDIGTPQWDVQGRFLGYVGSCIDVTEAHRSSMDLGVNGQAGSTLAFSRSADVLTRRETEVVELLARGLTNHAIAAELVISVGTVRVHVDHILKKLGLHSRAQVVAWIVSQDARPRRAAAHEFDSEVA
jgi:PAS domain S-box-containing protein